MEEPSIRDLLGTRTVPPGPPRLDAEPSAVADHVGASAQDEAARAVAGEDVSEIDNEATAVAFVYVPIQPRRPDSDPDTVTFELRSIAGEAGLAIYTERERLVAELGEYQPHVRIPILNLLVRLARERLPIAVDPALTPGADRWTEESIKTWGSAQ